LQGTVNTKTKRVWGEPKSVSLKVRLSEKSTGKQGDIKRKLGAKRRGAPVASGRAHY